MMLPLHTFSSTKKPLNYDSHLTGEEWIVDQIYQHGSCRNAQRAPRTAAHLPCSEEEGETHVNNSLFSPILYSSSFVPRFTFHYIVPIREGPLLPGTLML